MRFTIRHRHLALLAACVLVGLGSAYGQGSSFDSGGMRIHYVEQGEGTPVVLVHGFIWTHARNWVQTGIMDALDEAGYRAIAFDHRGHGQSAKPLDPESYGLEMVLDVVRLLDHLGIDRAHSVGYSMGATIVNKLRAEYPERLLTATIGAPGWPGDSREAWAAEFDAAAAAYDQRDMGPLVRALTPAGQPVPTDAELAALNDAVFAIHDPLVLAAVARSMPDLYVSQQELGRNRVPTLAIVGDLDPLTADVERLAAVMSEISVVQIPQADHREAVGDPLFTSSLLGFLSGPSNR